jgi:hypothetical protein
MPSEPRQGRDLRAYARSTQFRLLTGGILILVFVGNLLIWAIYGSQAARMGLICTGIGLAPGLLIMVTLWIIDLILHRARDE